MTKIVLDADIISKINYLYKHLLDDPAQNPTNVPKIDPMGQEVTSIKQIASMLGVDNKTAGFYVLQDPNTSDELKGAAREQIRPGIYLAADDSFLPVLHQAHEILHSTSDSEKKSVRLVRTVAGVRKYGQPLGSIILSDGRQKLDNLVAMTNDVPGFQKMADRSGNIYYVGRRQGTYYVIDPRENVVLHTARIESDAYNWLNGHAGGGIQSAKKKPKKGKKS